MDQRRGLLPRNPQFRGGKFISNYDSRWQIGRSTEKGKEYTGVIEVRVCVCVHAYWKIYVV